MRYELIVTHQQPTCAGSPTRSEIRNIETDDPLTYVKEDQPDASDFRVYNPEEGLTVIEYTSGSGMLVKYEFTED